MSFLMRSIYRLPGSSMNSVSQFLDSSLDFYTWRGSDGSGSLDSLLDQCRMQAIIYIGLKAGSWKLAVVACDIVTRDTSWVGLQNLRLQTFETLRLETGAAGSGLSLQAVLKAWGNG